MSELTNMRENRTGFRLRLLATVSAMALAGSAFGIGGAMAADSDRPPVWIELGGQWNTLDEGQEAFSPPVMASRPSIFDPSQKLEHLPRSSIDEYGGISFEPEGSNWVFSASVRYGRSGSNKHVHQQTTMPAFLTITTADGGVSHFYPSGAKFADTRVKNDESHVELDFQAGKDVGLGMFGKNGSSVLSAGVRFAQFGSKSNIALKSSPDWHISYFLNVIPKYRVYHTNAASLTAERSFHGVGPSLSWNASAPVSGEAQSGELSVDWGVNAAVLFGRQRAVINHQTTALYHAGHQLCKKECLVTVYPTRSAHNPRSRSATVPNIGGFAGLSFRIENFKVSAGYRADFFFSAMDGGIDAAKKENVGFYGPFASVSVGIGG